MMKRALTIGLVAAAATAGCKKDREAEVEGPVGVRGTSVQKADVPRPSQGTLPTMPPLELREDKRRGEKIALGHALFFDPRLSVDGSLACYSCHQNEHGNGGGDPVAIGPKGPLPRHSPVVWNVAYFKNAFYWDGRAATLEAQAKGAWSGGNMAVGEDGLEAKTAELAQLKGYQALFGEAFPGEKPRAELITMALAEYMRTLVCADTAYDRFAAGDAQALTEEQQRGLDVFLGKGQCAVCHTPPFFSSAMNVEEVAYFNVGIGTQGKPEEEVDVGRMKVSGNASDWAAFKPPSLRNVARSAPYFHNGSVASLEEAVRLMATGGIPNKNLSPILTDRQLDAGELADLTAFLGALDCQQLEAPAQLP
jgi:cytochrome c peroxidase